MRSTNESYYVPRDLWLFPIAFYGVTIVHNCLCNSYNSIAIITITIRRIRNGKGCPLPDDNCTTWRLEVNN